MSTQVNQTEYVYHTFEPPVQTIVFVFILIWLQILVIGVVGNGILFLAIIVDKTLRSRCHFLIAAMALANVGTSASLCFNRFWFATGFVTMNQFYCLKMNLALFFAQNCQSGLQLALAIDRFLAVYTPVRYKNWSARWYLPGMLTPVVLFAVALMAYGYVCSDANSTVEGGCYPLTAYYGNSLLAFIFANLVMAVIIVGLYTATSLAVRFGNRTQTAATKHIITSLHYIVSVYSSTWVMTMLLATLEKSELFSSRTASDFVTLSMGTLTAIDASCGFIFYVWRSKDFRAAIFKLLRINQNHTISQPTIKTVPNTTRRNLIRSSIL